MSQASSKPELEERRLERPDFDMHGVFPGKAVFPAPWLSFFFGSGGQVIGNQNPTPF